MKYAPGGSLIRALCECIKLPYRLRGEYIFRCSHLPLPGQMNEVRHYPHLLTPFAFRSPASQPPRPARRRAHKKQAMLP